MGWVCGWERGGVGANKGEASDAVSLKCIQKLTQIVTPFMDEDFYYLYSATTGQRDKKDRR